jgi:hypothetical protein
MPEGVIEHFSLPLDELLTDVPRAAASVRVHILRRESQRKPDAFQAVGHGLHRGVLVLGMRHAVVEIDVHQNYVFAERGILPAALHEHRMRQRPEHEAR